MFICLERGADLHMAQLMPLPLTVSCFNKIQIGFTFLVPAYPGYSGKEAVKWLLWTGWLAGGERGLEVQCSTQDIRTACVSVRRIDVVRLHCLCSVS